MLLRQSVTPTALGAPWAYFALLCVCAVHENDLHVGGNAAVVDGASARIYADAGANYVFADDEHSGSVPLAFETVFDKGQNADFWLIKYNQAIDKTYKELEQDYAPYTGFRAFKERNIYGCNTGKVDFYEDSPFHPDRLLKDLIKIFHPTLLEGYELKYFTKLAE